MATIDASVSKSAQKNKKRREKKKQKETATTAEIKEDETTEEPAPVVEELNPIELIKQKIEEAKLAKVRYFQPTYILYLMQNVITLYHLPYL